MTWTASPRVIIIMVWKMDEFVQIKCPYCGAVLKVKWQPGLDKASITCPVCKRKTPFSQFQTPDKGNTDETEIPGWAKGRHGDASQADDHTTIQASSGGKGYVVEKSGKRWELHLGVNTIGRKTTKPPVPLDVPVTDYTGEMRMSRKHAKIEVVCLPNGIRKHVLSNWQNKNPTLIGGEPIDAEDRIVLTNGMTMTFANVEVRFVVDDDDMTRAE